MPCSVSCLAQRIAYDLAGSERLGVSVVALSVPAFSSQKGVSGKGTASFDLTGEALYAGMAVGASQAADGAAQTVALAAKGTGMHDYLQSAKGNINTVLGTVAVLKGLSLDAAYAGQVQTLDDAATSALDRINAALDVPPSNADEKKSKTVDAQASLPALQQAAKAVSERLAGATGLPLPKTGDDTKTPYDIKITRDGDLAMSTEMLVGTGSLVPDPTATSPSPAGGRSGGGSSQATATTRSSSGASGGSGTSGGQGSSAGSSSGGSSNAGAPGAANSGATRNAGSPALATPGTGSAAQGLAQAPPGAAAGDTAPLSAVDNAAAPAGAQAVATWTVVAGAADAVAQLPPGTGSMPSGGSSTAGGAGAPNLAIIAFGALLLVGAAVWLRRRM